MVRSAGSGRLFRVPFATDIRFSKAAAGLKNICENLDHGTDPNSTVVVSRYKPRKKVVQVVFPVYYLPETRAAPKRKVRRYFLGRPLLEGLAHEGAVPQIAAAYPKMELGASRLRT